MLPLGCFIMTVLFYYACRQLYRLFPFVWLSPLLLVPIALIAAVAYTHIPYEAYAAGNRVLTDMIGPATVAMAVPLHKNFAMLKKHGATIVISVFCGAVLAILTSALFSAWLHLGANLTESLAPRSATTPIAVAVSASIGGIPNITAVFVMVTGLLGIIVGPLAVRAFRIHNDIARGIMFGTSAHTAGTTKAFEFGSVSGSISSIAMILTAFFTLCAAPWVMRLLERFVF